jgi:8-oxo-dGTP pyrophosphatase MutT (NUDIX family)
MDVAAEVRHWLKTFEPGGDARARHSRDETIALVESCAQPGTRSHFSPGHVTVSGLVYSPASRAVLLVFHARLQRWLQPGGHLESFDRSLVDAARREVREETGIDVQAGPETVLVAVDVHEIPAARGEPAHRHHDLMFGFVAPGWAPAPGAGVLRAAWCPVDHLEEFAVDQPLRRAVARMLAGPPQPLPPY